MTPQLEAPGSVSIVLWGWYFNWFYLKYFSLGKREKLQKILKSLWARKWKIDENTFFFSIFLYFFRGHERLWLWINFEGSHPLRFNIQYFRIHHNIDFTHAEKYFFSSIKEQWLNLMWEMKAQGRLCILRDGMKRQMISSQINRFSRIWEFWVFISLDHCFQMSWLMKMGSNCQFFAAFIWMEENKMVRINFPKSAKCDEFQHCFSIWNRSLLIHAIRT